jgi:poly(3-hydroxybutyrate) depolymerase
MKAVNLMPAEGRGRRATGATPSFLTGSSEGLAAYGLLAVLAIAVAMAGGWALSGRQLADGKADLTRTEAAAKVAEAKVASLGPYTKFAAVSQARVETLSGLIKGRFDWSHGLREVARVVPKDVDLISLVGTTSPTSSVQGAGASGALRASLPVPAIDLIGCAKSQSDVALLLARLRAVDGVQRVSLASSEKSDSASLSNTDCRASETVPQFQVTVFFQALPGIVPSAAAAASPSTAAGTTPAAPAGGAK